MIPKPEILRQVYRLDALIGCGNLLSFAELLVEHFSREHPEPISLLSLDINAFAALNENRGHEQGDVTLRWLGILLEEATHSPVFRIGGDELVSVLAGGLHEDHAELAWRLFERLNVDAEKFGLGVPAATVSVIQYTGAEKINPAEVFVHLGTALLDAKQNAQKAFKVYRASELSLTGEGEYLRWLADQMIDRMVVLGAMLDESNRLAYTDQVTGLPNMRAAQQQLERQLAQAVAENGTISVLLIDGDDLREYNKISYAAGDAMIQRLGAILDDNLRPGDFLARWRIGDEFLVILPGTPTGQAEMVGERLCRAIQGASQEWPIPITISIGIASYPDFTSAGILLEEAEQANREAKEEGKNRVVIIMQK